MPPQRAVANRPFCFSNGYRLLVIGCPLVLFGTATLFGYVGMRWGVVISVFLALAGFFFMTLVLPLLLGGWHATFSADQSGIDDTGIRVGPSRAIAWVEVRGAMLDLIPGRFSRISCVVLEVAAQPVGEGWRGALFELLIRGVGIRSANGYSDYIRLMGASFGMSEAALVLKINENVARCRDKGDTH